MLIQSLRSCRWRSRVASSLAAPRQESALRPAHSPAPSPPRDQGTLGALQSSLPRPAPQPRMPAPAAPRHALNCACCAPTGAAQSLNEVSFEKSACAAAQAGDLFRVSSLVRRNPSLLHEDGYKGRLGALG